MSSGVKGATARSRVSFPSSVKKTIENMKEITGHNHSEDEIYAMLKECSMDPNETAQKLLLLDTFHEVKKKRDRRKENLNKEPAESRWRPGSQARVNRAGRWNYSSRHVSHDAGRNSSAVKVSATSHIPDKVISEAPLANTQEMNKSEVSSIASQITNVSNGPLAITSQSINGVHVSANEGVNQSNETGSTSVSKLEGALPFSTPIDLSKIPDAPGTTNIQQNDLLDSRAIPLPPIPASGSHFSSLGPVLLPSQHSPIPSAVGTIGCEEGSQHTPVELITDDPTERKSASSVQEKKSNDVHGVGKAQYVESVLAAASTSVVSSVSRPSSNYNNRSQLVGPQKVGPGKEWKPKSTNSSIGEGTSMAASTEVSTISVGIHPELLSIPSKEATLELQRKLEELNICDNQNVIIPNHLHVPDAGKLGFCFGSFDANFELDMIHSAGLGSDKSPPLSESSEAIDEPAKEPQLSNRTVLAAVENTEVKYPEHIRSPSQGREEFSSSEVEVSSSITNEYGEPKQEVSHGSHQHHVVHTPNYNYGFMPPILSGQITPFESSESQARDVPQHPGFVVQQSFDPVSYYAQFYRSGMVSDGCISAGGNAALVSAQTSQSPQEGGAPLVLSTASPVPLITQAAGGVMPSSITASQQPLPVFCQPTGVHVPHYPQFIPYGPYFSPFYVPPPAIHQFLGSGAFPQQPQGSNLYLTPSGTTAKYSASQYKQGSNAGSSSHIGMPGSYGPYGPALANYTSSSFTAPVTSASNDDVATQPQVKENHIYISGHQSEGSGVSQGQLAFTPTQPGHGTFTGIFHPAQAVAAATVHPLLQQSQSIHIPVDMVGPTAGIYQQQHQHAQHNWSSNF